MVIPNRKEIPKQWRIQNPNVNRKRESKIPKEIMGLAPRRRQGGPRIGSFRSRADGWF